MRGWICSMAAVGVCAFTGVTQTHAASVTVEDYHAAVRMHHKEWRYEINPPSQTLLREEVDEDVASELGDETSMELAYFRDPPLGVIVHGRSISEFDLTETASGFKMVGRTEVAAWDVNYPDPAGGVAGELNVTAELDVRVRIDRPFRLTLLSDSDRDAFTDSGGNMTHGSVMEGKDQNFIDAFGYTGKTGVISELPWPTEITTVLPAGVYNLKALASAFDEGMHYNAVNKTSSVAFEIHGEFVNGGGVIPTPAAAGLGLALLAGAATRRPR